MSRKACIAIVEALKDMLPITSTSNILDCGAGLGTRTTYILDSYPEVPMMAFDVAPGMVERLKHLNLPRAKIKFNHVTHIDRVTAPRDGFTHVLAAHIIQFLGSKQPTAVIENFDSLAPGVCGDFAVGRLQFE
ncbi:hypothetical protein F5Y16DRAFT_402371 [Xylariaceae sp. FL0255]|nr:hypothetical protein F5Y16DRAFT_402371 [Xylariaceae sp. FL0255]